jgi:hypothetical protein
MGLLGRDRADDIQTMHEHAWAAAPQTTLRAAMSASRMVEALRREPGNLEALGALHAAVNRLENIRDVAVWAARDRGSRSLRTIAAAIHVDKNTVDKMSRRVRMPDLPRGVHMDSEVADSSTPTRPALGGIEPSRLDINILAVHRGNDPSGDNGLHAAAEMRQELEDAADDRERAEIIRTWIRRTFELGRMVEWGEAVPDREFGSGPLDRTNRHFDFGRAPGQPRAGSAEPHR